MNMWISVFTSFCKLVYWFPTKWMYIFQEFNSLKEEFYEKFNDDGEFNGFSRSSDSNEEIQQLKVSLS